MTGRRNLRRASGIDKRLGLRPDWKPSPWLERGLAEVFEAPSTAQARRHLRRFLAEAPTEEDRRALLDYGESLAISAITERMRKRTGQQPRPKRTGR